MVLSGPGSEIRMLDLPRSYYNKSEVEISILIPNCNFETLDIDPIISNRIILKLYDPSDSDAYREIIREPSISWNHSRMIYHQQEAPVLNIPQRYSSILDLGVYLRDLKTEKMKLIGFLSYFGSEDNSGTPTIPEINYGISKDFQGKGYGTEAVSSFVDYIFSLPSQEVNVKEDVPSNILKVYPNSVPRGLIKANTFVDNEPSISLLKRVGFQLCELSQDRWPITDNALLRSFLNRGENLLEPGSYRSYINDAYNLYGNKMILKSGSEIVLSSTRTIDLHCYS